MQKIRYNEKSRQIKFKLQKIVYFKTSVHYSLKLHICFKKVKSKKSESVKILHI